MYVLCTHNKLIPINVKMKRVMQDPNVRCKAFGFCAASTTNVASPPLARVTLAKTEPAVKVIAGGKSSVSPQCVLCEFVVKELDSLIADNATEVRDWSIAV